MDYFVLNINYDKKSEVDYWLNERRLAPIFYGNATLSQIQNNKDHGLKPRQYIDAKNFVNTFRKVNRDAVIFSIGNEYVYIYKQAGPLREIEKYKNDLVKAFRIKLVRKEKIKFCPLVLVSIKADLRIASGTFKSLSSSRYDGNTKALEYLIDRKPAKVIGFAKYLQCLSSLEFETLIAKYLEESGFFVPAYKGGFIRNYDLFCRNITGKTIQADKISVRPKDAISVQIKLHLKRENYKKDTDHFFCISTDISSDNIHDHTYLQRNMEKNLITRKWLTNTLYWVDF